MERDTRSERVTGGEFVGRREALDALGAWIDGGHSTVVVGPPGVGKSRLVRQLVAVRPELTYGWVDLGDVSDADGVSSAVATALSLPPLATTEQDAWVTALVRALNERAFDVVVFDGAEVVATATFDLLRRLRSAHARALFVVTSQVEPAVAGLRVLHLPPLSLDSADGGLSDAAALLIARARAAEPALRFEADDAPALEALANALDGLPLALELAAARLPMLGPAQMLTRLVDRFRILGRAGPDGSTLVAALNSAYQLLDPIAQDTLRQIAVFRGGFDLEAAEHVVDLSSHSGAPWVLDALTTLRTHSLLVVEHASRVAPDVRGLPRYSLLASVRAFAAGLLSDEVTRALQSRVAEHFADRWRRYAPDALHPTAESANLLAADGENLWAAAWSATTLELPPWVLATLVLGVTGPSPFIRYAASLPLLDAATQRARTIAPASVLVAQLGVRHANLLRFLGRIGDSERLLVSLEAHMGTAVLPESAFAIACAFGNAAAARIAPAEAREHFDRALALASSTGERADVLSMKAATHFAEDQLDLAAACLEGAVTLATAPLPAAIALGSLGIVDFTRGQTASGIVRLLAAHDELVRLGSRHWAAVVLTYLGRADHERGELDLAARRLELARSDAERIGVGRAEAQARLSLGALHLELGALESADAELARALVLIRATCPDHESLALGLRAVVAARRSASAPEATPRPGIVGGDELRLRAEAALARYPRPQFEAALAVLAGKTTAPPNAESWFEVRLARRLIGQLTTVEPELVTPPLVLARDGAWFRLPGEAEVSLRRRQPLRRILARLSDARTVSPGRVVTVTELVAAGWPGERVLPEAGVERVYTAIATLRRLGLRHALQRRDDGYLLCAEHPVVWS